MSDSANLENYLKYLNRNYKIDSVFKNFQFSEKLQELSIKYAKQAEEIHIQELIQEDNILEGNHFTNDDYLIQDKIRILHLFSYVYYAKENYEECSQKIQEILDLDEENLLALINMLIVISKRNGQTELYYQKISNVLLDDFNVISYYVSLSSTYSHLSTIFLPEALDYFRKTEQLIEDYLKNRHLSLEENANNSQIRAIYAVHGIGFLMTAQRYAKTISNECQTDTNQISKIPIPTLFEQCKDMFKRILRYYNNYQPVNARAWIIFALLFREFEKNLSQKIKEIGDRNFKFSFSLIEVIHSDTELSSIKTDCTSCRRKFVNPEQYCSHLFAIFAIKKALRLCTNTDVYSLIQISKLMRDGFLSFEDVEFHQHLNSELYTEVMNNSGILASRQKNYWHTWNVFENCEHLLLLAKGIQPNNTTVMDLLLYLYHRTCMLIHGTESEKGRRRRISIKKMVQLFLNDRTLIQNKILHEFLPCKITNTEGVASNEGECKFLCEANKILESAITRNQNLEHFTECRYVQIKFRMLAPRKPLTGNEGNQVLPPLRAILEKWRQRLETDELIEEKSRAQYFDQHGCMMYYLGEYELASSCFIRSIKKLFNVKYKSLPVVVCCALPFIREIMNKERIDPLEIGRISYVFQHCIEEFPDDQQMVNDLTRENIEESIEEMKTLLNYI